MSTVPVTPAELPGERPRPAAEVIYLDSLRQPSQRPPNHEALSHALLQLAKTLSASPDSVAQHLVEAACRLTGADSAGMSLEDVDDGKPVFRWIATTGEYARYADGTMPRHFSPCGEVLDRGMPLLMRDMRRAYPYVDALHAPPSAVLLVPFAEEGKLAGTIWVVRHDADKSFDSEDLRMVQSLAVFAEAVSSTVGLVRNLKAKEARQYKALEFSERELKDTRRLQEVAARMIGADGGTAIYLDILDAAIDIVDASAGTIQLLDAGTQTLSFLATRGFGHEIVNHFQRVDASSGSPCGVAMRSGRQSFVVFDGAAGDPDGSTRWHLDAGVVCAQSMPLVSRSGRPLGMFSTHWATRRELSERELRFLELLGRQAADLIERNEVLKTLQAREQELRLQGQRKDEFIATLAHELRNPLSPIRTGIDLLKTVRDPLVERLRPMMERQATQIVRLVDDLLEVSRITSGKVQLKLETVTLGQLITTALEAQQGAIEAGGIQLSVHLDDATRRLHVDPARLSQVVSNVLHNAVKFTPPGGRIILRTELEVTGDGALPHQVIRITDSGLGIPGDMLSSIFDLFTQARPESSMHQGGLGIGLALSRRLVELHGGTVIAQSAGHNQGSEFTVRIPVVATSGFDVPSTSLASVTWGTGVAVLVVDDNEDAADGLAMLLSQQGCDVRVAYGATACIEVLESFTPSLVFLDIGMPGIDGYEACRRIREVGSDGLFIAALTGWGQEGDRRKAADAGFDLHLTKPVESNRLEEVFRLALGRRRANGLG